MAVSYSMHSAALESDRDQPADIEADNIEFDFPNGTRTFINNVLVVQGTLRIKADKLIGKYKGDKVEQATAWGSLARFKQRPDGKPDDVEGWAKKIVVNQVENTLTLIGKAALKQGADIARGDTIIYNMATDKLQIKGGAQLGSGGKDGTKKPKRKLEDPFKDDAQGPPPDAPSATTATEKANQPAAKTTPSGRSRLIIRPKSVNKDTKKKPKPAKKSKNKKGKSKAQQSADETQGDTP